jgi:hypothetical protein
MGIEVFPVPASGPSLAEITSAITTNAAPSSVTMPAITSSITTNAASSGVTLSAIGTQVANNASPYGGTITSLGVVTATNVSTTTFSSLSSYKYLKFYIMVGSAASDIFAMRFNGDTGANYRWGTTTDRGTGASTYNVGDNSFFLDNGSGNSNSNVRVWTIEIPMSNSGAYKMYNGFGPGTTDGAAPAMGFSHGTWNSTAAISSVTFFMRSNNNFTATQIYGIGAS